MGAGVVLHLPAWAMPLGSPLSPGGHLLGGLPQQAKAQDVCAQFWVLHREFLPSGAAVGRSWGSELHVLAWRQDLN